VSFSAKDPGSVSWSFVLRLLTPVLVVNLYVCQVYNSPKQCTDALFLQMMLQMAVCGLHFYSRVWVSGLMLCAVLQMGHGDQQERRLIRSGCD